VRSVGHHGVKAKVPLPDNSTKSNKSADSVQLPEKLEPLKAPVPFRLITGQLKFALPPDEVPEQESMIERLEHPSPAAAVSVTDPVTVPELMVSVPLPVTEQFGSPLSITDPVNGPE